MKRYNRDVYWTSELDDLVATKLNKQYTIEASCHSKQRLLEKNLPQNCYKCCLFGKVVEIELEYGEITKIITRLQNKFDKNTDICFCVIFKDDIAFVKTVWVNATSDNHKTIRIENYCTA